MGSMRRFPITVAVVFALALAGCGSHPATTPLEHALSHYSADAPLVAVVSTGITDRQSLASVQLGLRLPLAKKLTRRLLSPIRGNRISFIDDIAPWLGKWAVIGARESKDISRGRFLLATTVRNTRALQRILKRLSGSALKPAGKQQGAQLYRLAKGKAVVAANGNVLLLAGSTSQLDQALKTTKSSEAFDLQRLVDATGGSYKRSLASLYLDIHRLIASRSGRDRSALRIPWVASLKTLGVTARADQDVMDLRFLLKSDGRDLNPEDVPIATGRKSPRLLATSGGYFTAGIRNLAHTIRFSETAASALSPTGSALYEQAKTTLRERLGVDIDQDLIDQLAGDSALVIGSSGLGTKAQLSDPARMRRALVAGAGVGAAALKILGLGERYKLRAARRGAAAIYEFRKDGRLLARFGLSGRDFEIGLGKIDPGAIRTVSSKSLAAGGGLGSLLFSADVGKLSRLLSRQLPAMRSLSPYLRGFGMARGSVDAGTKRMKGRLEVQIR